jgi:hypothetical protein
MLRRPAALLGWLVLVALPLGCDSGPTEEQVSVQMRLKGVAVFYGRYQSAHRGRTPQSEKDFLSYLSSVQPAELETFGASTPDELLHSPVDGKAFLVHYGVQQGPPSLSGESPIVAQEAAEPGKSAVGVTFLGEIKPVESSAAT